MLVSLMKTTKSINKPLQTDENSSVKALEYNEAAAKVSLSSKTEDGYIETHKKCCICIVPVFGLEKLITKRDPHPRGRRRVERPSKPHHHCGLL